MLVNCHCILQFQVSLDYRESLEGSSKDLHSVRSFPYEFKKRVLEPGIAKCKLSIDF